MHLGRSFALPFCKIYLSENTEFLKLMLIVIVLFKTFQTSFEVPLSVEEVGCTLPAVFREIV